MINATMENNAGTATMMDERVSSEANTAQYEMVEQLAHKCGVSMEEANAALEANGWNVLTATYQLEQEAFRRKQELSEIIRSSEQTSATEAATDEQTAADSQAIEVKIVQKKAKRQKTGETAKKLGAVIRDLIKQGNRNRFVIHRDGEQLLDMPVTILVLLLIGSVGTCAFLMVLGLFLGCRYTINSIGAVAS